MSLRPFKLALVQMEVQPGQKRANLARAEVLIAEAALNGARVAILPETMSLGWTDQSAFIGADSIPIGVSCQALMAMAKSSGLHICAGLVERDSDSIYNSAVLIDPAGSLLLRHRKLNELEIAHNMYQCGTELRVAETAFGRFGIMICADAFVPGQFIGRALGHMGAEVILSPSAWAVSANHDNKKDPYGQLWRDNYQPVAKKFGLWIAGASNVGKIVSGPWRGRKCIGCSLVVGPKGQVVVQGPYGESAEAIIYVEIH